MALKHYGVLKASAVDVRPGISANPHYQIKVVDETDEYRLAINVKSKINPSALYFLVEEAFSHPLTEQLTELSFGFHELPRKPGGLALDYIRGNLFDPGRMRPLPFDVPGPDNDLNELVGHFVERAVRDSEAILYAYGERWGPEPRRDKIFGFRPGRGLHDIHMNQGNDPTHRQDDGVWQDGGLLLHFPEQQQWVAVFLAFQSQTWHTDDHTGHALPGFRRGLSGYRRAQSAPPGGALEEVLEAGEVFPLENTVRIVAARVNPVGGDGISGAARETVTLLNTTTETINLEGWALTDRMKNAFFLSGTLDAGETVRIELDLPIQLSNKGGIITLLDSSGVKVHGVAYTRAQAAIPGATLFF